MGERARKTWGKRKRRGIGRGRGGLEKEEVVRGQERKRNEWGGKKREGVGERKEKEFRERERGMGKRKNTGRTTANLGLIL